MYTRILFFVGIVLLIGGCSNLNIKDLDAWQNVNLRISELAPTKEQFAFFASKPRVVVDKFREPDDRRVRTLSSLANLASTLTGSTEEYLTQVGIEIVNRGEAQKLLGEVKLAELKNKVGDPSGYNGPQVAQYVIVGHINSVDTSAVFQEAYYIEVPTYINVPTTEGKTEKKEQIEQIEKKRIPPQCTYSANVVGKLRIYMVPKLRVAKSISVRNGATRTEDSRGSCRKDPTNFTALIRQAGERAIGRVGTTFQNFFAPKGYIVEMRRDKKGKKYLIKVTVGSERGLTKGRKADIFTQTLQKNPFTGETLAEERKLTTGRVTNQIGESYAWIILDKPKFANRLKIGDYVKIKF